MPHLWFTRYHITSSIIVPGALTEVPDFYIQAASSPVAGLSLTAYDWYIYFKFLSFSSFRSSITRPRATRFLLIQPSRLVRFRTDKNESEPMDGIALRYPSVTFSEPRTLVLGRGNDPDTESDESKEYCLSLLYVFSSDRYRSIRNGGEHCKTWSCLS